MLRRLGIEERLDTRFAIAAAIACAASSLASAPAWAQGRATSTIPVSVDLLSACSLATRPLQFGIVNRGVPTVRATTTMQVDCPVGTVYSIGIDNGLWWDVNTRRMHGNDSNGQVWYADYSLFRDPLYALPWGSTPSTMVNGLVLLPGPVTHTLYGQANPRNLRPAPYTDTVTVTLHF